MKIPQDWSNLSDTEALKYINYLIKHVYKYKITKDEEKVIHIGDVASIKRSRKDGFEAYMINNKYFTCDCGVLFQKADDLYDKLRYKLKPFKTKAKEWWECRHAEAIAWTVIIALLAGLSFACVKVIEQDKREKEQFKQEIIKEALEKFKQEQQKTINAANQNSTQKVK